MAELPQKLPENRDNENSGSPDAEAARQAALSTKKRKTLMMWLRIIALLFAGLFFLSRCAMSEKAAKAQILESCIENVPAVPKWHSDLKQRGLNDNEGKLVTAYCRCMWQEPLDKLNKEQVQSLSAITPDEQIKLIFGSNEAFSRRDNRCLDNLAH